MQAVSSRIYRDNTDTSSTNFLCSLNQIVPTRIQRALCAMAANSPAPLYGQSRCWLTFLRYDPRRAAIQHPMCLPGHPQTNGMVGRFNWSISDWVKRTRFASSEELEITLTLYLMAYSRDVSQRALKHQTPFRPCKYGKPRDSDGLSTEFTNR